MPSQYQLHREKWADGCGNGICSRARKRVFARGSIPCDILLVGEGPGESENIIGKPFVGPAGHLLNDMLARSLDGLMWPGVFDENGGDVPLTYAITNVVCCLPTEEDGSKKGEPTEEETEQCFPRLLELIRMCRPSAIVRVGRVSARFLNQDRLAPVDWIPSGGRILFRDIIHPGAILKGVYAGRSLAINKNIVALQVLAGDLFEGKHLQS